MTRVRTVFHEDQITVDGESSIRFGPKRVYSLVDNIVPATFAALGHGSPLSGRAQVREKITLSRSGMGERHNLTGTSPSELLQGRPVAVIGAGLVGAGWAIVFAQAGLDVRIYDVNPDATEWPSL